MIHFDAGDLADDLVGLRVDEHDAVARGIRLDNSDGCRLQRQGERQDQSQGHDERFGLHSHTL